MKKTIVFAIVFGVILAMTNCAKYDTPLTATNPTGCEKAKCHPTISDQFLR